MNREPRTLNVEKFTRLLSGSGNFYKTVCIENGCLCMCVSVDEIDCMAKFVQKKVVKKDYSALILRRMFPYKEIIF